ncbi:hypothetical protein N7490_007473 [Penicillium lividum]|nr:hypothetical protein N7490_007473 [Penicillium lividum]
MYEIRIGVRDAAVRVTRFLVVMSWRTDCATFERGKFGLKDGGEAVTGRDCQENAKQFKRLNVLE